MQILVGTEGCTKVLLHDHVGIAAHTFADPADNNEQQQQPPAKHNRKCQSKPIAAKAPASA